MVSINGFLVSAERHEIGIHSFRVPGSSVVLPVRAEVAPLLIGFARDFHTHVQPLRAGWCWGYAFRAVRGGTTPSFHSAGLAIDLNAPAHPLGRRGTFDPDRRRMIRALADRYGLRWGGDYRVRADEMHFEVILTRRRALDLVAVVQRRGEPRAVAQPNRREGRRVPADKKDPQFEKYRRGVPLGGRTLALECAGDDVCFVQRWLGLDDDGYFGRRTDQKVRRYQVQRHVVADGRVGPITWRQMGIRSN